MDQSSDAPSVLIVDGDEHGRHLRVRALAGHFRTLTAQDAAEALDVARRAMPDLIVSRMVLPNMDGVGLCGEVRRDRRLATIPVLIADTLPHEHDVVRRVLAAGADDYLA